LRNRLVDERKLEPFHELQHINAFSLTKHLTREGFRRKFDGA